MYKSPAGVYMLGLAESRFAVLRSRTLTVSDIWRNAGVRLCSTTGPRNLIALNPHNPHACVQISRTWQNNHPEGAAANV